MLGLCICRCVKSRYDDDHPNQYAIRMKFGTMTVRKIAMLLLLFSVLMCLLTDNETVSATSCSYQRSLPALAFNHSTAVFRGERVDKHIRRSRYTNIGWHEFRVSKVWKGRVQETMFLPGHFTNSFCGPFFEDRGEYIVYAGRSSSEEGLPLIIEVVALSPSRDHGMFNSGTFNGTTIPFSEATPYIENLDEAHPPVPGSNIDIGDLDILWPYSDLSPLDAWMAWLLAAAVLAWLAFRKIGHQRYKWHNPQPF